MYSDEGDNLFTSRVWEKLVKAVTQRNSMKGMCELELVGKPLLEHSDDESSGDSEY